MARANLKGQAEIEFLRQAVRQTFEQTANRTLIANTNKGNYLRLAEEISEIANAKAKGTRLERMDMTVSDGQVRSLFIESNKDFLDYFVQACYFYTQGMSREDFLGKTENSDLVKTWEEGRVERQIMGISAAQNGVEEALQNEKLALETEFQKLKIRQRNWTVAGGLFLAVCLALCVFDNQQKRHKLERVQIWTGNKGNIEKSVLMPHLTFLQPELGFLGVVDTIVQSLTTPSVFDAGNGTLPIVHFKNIVQTSGYRKFGNSFYPDQISIIPFHFDSLRLETAVAKTIGMAAYLRKRYDKVAVRDDGTFVERDILAKIMRLEKTDFDVDLIYVGYKQDVSNAASDDFMLRYPPYRLDDSDLQNYVMVTRQWWKEAIEKTGIHWQQDFGGKTLYCGISKPYPTVRQNAPNQRTFWVEIAPDSLNNKARMVLAIDLILKD
jgi:hypothetical protein